MISDAEQRRLDEIERLLRLEDPALVRRFDQRPRPPRCSVRSTVLTALAILLTVVVAAVGAASGAPIAALVTVFIATAVCVGVVLWRRRAQPPGRRR
jgi:Flp pilus assembly protein TadB